MNRQALLAKRDRLLAQQQATLNAADAANRVLTPEEQAEYDDAVARISEINAQIDGPTFPRAGGYGQPGDTEALETAPVQPLGMEPAPRISAVHSGVKLVAFKNDRQGREAAYRTGRWVAATLVNHAPSRGWCLRNGMPTDPMAALSGGSNPGGGALVPSEMENRIIELMDVYGSFRQNADNLPMSTDTLTVPRRVGGLTAYYTGENTAGTESDASWDNVTFSAKKLMCLTRMSSEVSEDAIINLGDKMAQEMTLAFAYKEDVVGFTGDGTGTYGGIVGVLVKAIDGSHNKAKVAAATGHNLLPEINSTDLLNLMAVIPTYAKKGAKWYCSPTALAVVFDAIKVAGGGNTLENLANAVSPSFLGYPIVVTPVMPDDPTTDLLNKVMIGFGNLAMAATVATRRGIRVALSDARYFELDQIAVKGTMRHDIVAHDLGSNTVKSPFAVLVGA